MNVAVLGASKKPDRYSNRAVNSLLEKGHTVFPVHPVTDQISGLDVYHSIQEIESPIDTVTIYLRAELSSQIGEAILAKQPRRVIFNPGAENPELESKAQEQGIKTLQACTLVLLNTGQF